MVLGSDGNGGIAAYIVDHHHELSALDLSGYTSTDVTINIVCDYTSLSVDALWSKLASENFAYLLGRPSSPGKCSGSWKQLPSRIPYCEFDWFTRILMVHLACLPTAFVMTEDNQTLVDDPFRSLSSFVRKVTSAT